jgi:hypothetical protein
MTKLTPIQQEWVDALRSGKYKQGKGTLRRGDEFCCLGVLCEIAVKHGVIAPAKKEEETNIFSYEGVIWPLPPKVQSFAGVKNRFGKLDNINSLAKRNDTGTTLLEIADLIENNADTLFVQASEKDEELI